MAVANTPIKICSRASLLIGGNAIQSFSDGSAEASVCDAMYEDMARAALTNNRWRFASDQEVLSRLIAAPTARWSAAYQKPTEAIMISAVTVNDNLIQYDSYGSKIYCNEGESSEVVCDYIFRANEPDWPPYFVVAVEYVMAAVLAVSVARDPQMAQLMEAKADYQMRQARLRESQSQTTRKLNTSRFITERRS